MTATGEFTPPAELTEGGAGGGSRRRLWLYGGLGLGAVLILGLGLLLVPAAAPEEPPAPATGLLVPAAEPLAPPAPAAEAPAEPPPAAVAEPAPEPAVAAVDPLSAPEPAVAAVPPTTAVSEPGAPPAPSEDPDALRQQMLAASDAAGPGDLPMTDAAADRAMVAVGLGPAPEPPAAADPNLVLVQGRVNTGGGVLNVRRTPGLAAAVIGQVADGLPLDLSAWATAPDGGIWVRIQDPDAGPIDQGWVFALLVDMEDEHTALHQVVEFN